MIRLICLDMDGVLVRGENFWLSLHERFGTLEEGNLLTKRYLHTDYQRLVEEVVGRLWRGRNAQPYLDLVQSYAFMPNIKSFFSELDEFKFGSKRVPRAIISGGCYEVAVRVREAFGIDDIFANRLTIKDGKVSGAFEWPIGAGGETKVHAIGELCNRYHVPPEEALYIGDSPQDIHAFNMVGTSIAFGAKDEALNRVATYVVDSSDLRDVIPVLREIRTRP